MKRVWKPLDVGGLRLYKVKRRFIWKPDGKGHVEESIVAASTPRAAASIIERIYTESDKQNTYCENITYTGYALDVLMPESWWRDGVPDEHVNVGAYLDQGT